MLPARSHVDGSGGLRLLEGDDVSPTESPGCSGSRALSTGCSDTVRPRRTSSTHRPGSSRAGQPVLVEPSHVLDTARPDPPRSSYTARRPGDERSRYRRPARLLPEVRLGHFSADELDGSSRQPSACSVDAVADPAARPLAVHLLDRSAHRPGPRSARAEPGASNRPGACARSSGPTGCWRATRRSGGRADHRHGCVHCGQRGSA